MSKSLYSLILNDELVALVDRQAMRSGSNRSGMINRIIAEYFGVMTPEKELEALLDSISSLVGENVELVPVSSPKNSTVSFKSSLNVKYRPTVKYDVSLYRTESGTDGTLTVYFRTQSAALLEVLEEFFGEFAECEKDNGIKAEHTLENGKFTRSIMLPSGISMVEAGEKIKNFINVLDYLMKDYVEYRNPEKMNESYKKMFGIGEE